MRIGINKEVIYRIIDNTPTCTREDALLHRLVAEIPTVALIESTGCAHQVCAIVITISPSHLLAIESKLSLQVLSRKLLALDISQRHVIGFDHKSSIALLDLKIGHGEVTINESQSCIVLELTVLSPLHTDKLRSKHRKTGITRNHNSLLVCLGIIVCIQPLRVVTTDKSRKSEQAQKQILQFHNFKILLVWLSISNIILNIFREDNHIFSIFPRTSLYISKKM